MMKKTHYVLYVVCVGLMLTGISSVEAQQQDDSSHLQDDIARLQKAFDFFRQEHDQLKADWMTEQQKNQQLSGQLARFREALQKNQQIVAIYKRKLQSAAGTPSELRQRLDEATTRLVELESEQVRLQDEVSRLQLELTRELRIRKAQEEMTQQKEVAAHDALLEAEAAQRRVALLEGEREKLLLELTGVRGQLDGQQARYVELERMVSGYERRLAEAAEQKEQEAQQLTAVRQEARQLEAERQHMKRQLSQQQADFESRLQKAGQVLEELAQAQAEKKRLDEQLTAVRTQLQEEQAERRNLEAGGRTQEQQVFGLRNQLQEQSRQISRLQGERDQLAGELSQFEKALESERARGLMQEAEAKQVKESAASTQLELSTLQAQLKTALMDREAALEDARYAQERLARVMEGQQDEAAQVAAAESRGYEAGKLARQSDLELLERSLQTEQERVKALQLQLEQGEKEWAQAKIADEQELRSEYRKLKKAHAIQERSLQELSQQLATQEREQEEQQQQAALRMGELERALAEKKKEVKQQEQLLKQQSATVSVVQNERSFAPQFRQPLSEGDIVALPADAPEAVATVEVVKAPEPEPAPAPEPEPVTMVDAEVVQDDFSELEDVLAEMETAGVDINADMLEQDVERLQAEASELYAQGNLLEATQVLDELLAKDEQHVAALGLRGVIAWQAGEYTQALGYLNKASVIDDSDASVQNYLGIVYNSMQQADKAEAAFRASIRLDSEYDEPLFNLAVVIATRDPQRVDEARKMYERSLLLGSDRNNQLEEILYP